MNIFVLLFEFCNALLTVQLHLHQDLIGGFDFNQEMDVLKESLRKKIETAKAKVK